MTNRSNSGRLSLSRAAATILSMAVALSLSSFSGSADGITLLPKQLNDSDKEPKKVKKPKKSSTAPTETGVPALWEDRGDISRLDLIRGIGSEDGMPKPPFRFDKEDLTGSNPKIKVIDANGVKWNVKFKELSGLAILNFLLSNWDAKVINNNVLGMYDEDGKVKDWYLITDWGGTFGKTGGYKLRTKWDLDDYSKQKLIDGVKGDTVKFRYSGKLDGALKTIPREHVQWFSGIIGKLTDNQIRDAFKAAGATQDEIDGFTLQLRKRINELKATAGR